MDLEDWEGVNGYKKFCISRSKRQVMAARNRDGGRKFVLISLALKRHHQLEEKKEDAVSRQEREDTPITTSSCF